MLLIAFSRILAFFPVSSIRFAVLFRAFFVIVAGSATQNALDGELQTVEGVIDPELFVREHFCKILEVR